MFDLKDMLRSRGWMAAYADEPALRQEILTADQMKRHGEELAALHRLSSRRGFERLLARLASNEEVLVDVSRILTKALSQKWRIMPAGEWLLDNFYLIEEQIRLARRHLPSGYSRELPRLLDGPAAGLPRVYAIALEAVSHGDGRMEPETLSQFVSAYQTVAPLNLGELWAIPIMLRLALIENLRRVAAHIARDHDDRQRAAYWSEQMKSIVDRDPKSLILVTADMARSNPTMNGAFVAEFVNRLQGRASVLALPLTWIEQRLSENNQTIDQVVQGELQQQAADQVSVSNSIGSLRTLSTTDWRSFVESLSLVEQVLREDPAAVYLQMDFLSRDRYRQAVEHLARRSRLRESQIAREAITLSRQADSLEPDDRRRHVGYYLIDAGLPSLRRKIGLPPVFPTRLPPSLYLAAIGLPALLIAASLTGRAWACGVPDDRLIPLFFLILLCSSQVTSGLINWLASVLHKPALLPRLDYSSGIPPESRTLVVVPCMLSSEQSANGLAEGLEVCFLANRDHNLHFGLLTDFKDAPTETLATDEPLVQLVREKIEALNLKYAGPAGGAFYLFHRPRLYNARERTWMGYERKRGKLIALNKLLRGASPETDFSLVEGRLAVLPKIHYIITLDADTQLPRDAARAMVGAMAHPLNRAKIDEKTGIVREGYGILQPRMAQSLGVVVRSRYTRLFGGEAGVDPYTRAIADVYQDLFREGSFIGKGIYDVDVFARCLGERFPENRVLSHDLLEGCHVRSGLISDVQLYESFPPRYEADVTRRHRWIRGDWQIARWCLSRVPGPDQARVPNPLSLLSQWKILDNLRRSLFPFSALLLLLASWLMLPEPTYWTLAILAAWVVPVLLSCLWDLLNKQHEMPVGRHLVEAVERTTRRFGQVVFTLALLPYEALFSLDAVLRSLFRLTVTHRGLLEWTPSHDVDSADGHTLAGSYRALWITPILAAATAQALGLYRPAALLSAVPFVILWLAGPAAAWWLGRPIRRRPVRLSADQVLFLRETARKTWAYFDVFVGPQDNWLPPDNVQLHPAQVTARRTSPTNLGLSLLANLAAHDFHYLSTGRLIERTKNTFQTMERLKRYRGHFFNWYDTETLAPLPPLYVSSVDSGNLAGHLLTLRQGLLQSIHLPIVGPGVYAALADTLRIMKAALAKDEAAPLGPFTQLLTLLSETPPHSLTDMHDGFARLEKALGELEERFNKEPGTEAAYWAHALAGQCRDTLAELDHLAPWLPLYAGADTPPVFEILPGIPSLHDMADCTALLATAETTPPDLKKLINDASRRARVRIHELESLARLASEMARLDYDFLYDPSRHLLSIGYNVDARRRDPGYYDLLASEARLTTFTGIAQGELPQESWFAMGRLLTTAAGTPILLSWSGSMFEYLMPLLVMPSYEDTLLDQTCRAAVQRQIDYGHERGTPWGVSESGYNTTDAHLTYQYRAFGVPGLGLKRGLAEELVIAPYASALALMVAPEAACRNLQRLAGEGFEGRYGFFEAIDYTRSRTPRGQPHVVIRSFMAHHQAMSLLSLDNLLYDRPMQRRFESDPAFQATSLLLQERIPRIAAPFVHTSELAMPTTPEAEPETRIRVFETPLTPVPESHLLSNGRYHVMITNSGGGYSRWKDRAITRWREDGVCDNWGQFCYLRDATSGKAWSTTFHPMQKKADSYEAVFLESRAEFRCRQHDLIAHTEITVSPEDDIEIRRLTLVNRHKGPRILDLTSYAEVVLATPASDILHPAFGNLFVQTEILPDRQAILCTRRPRSNKDQEPWMFHLMAVHGTQTGEVSYETDRARFIGRGRTPADPQAMTSGDSLSGSQDSVLDPIFAIRRRIMLEIDGSATINLVTGVAETREACLALLAKYQDRLMADRVFDLAWTHSQVSLRQLNATEADAQLYSRLAGSILYANPALRANPNLVMKNCRSQSGLWGHSISGDLPIVLLRIHDVAHIDLVRQLVQAHAYWRLRGLAVDLVIWNEDRAGYRQNLHDRIMDVIASAGATISHDKPGGIFVRPSDQIPEEDRILVQTVARVILSDAHGSLVDQLARRLTQDRNPPMLQPVLKRKPELRLEPKPRADLSFFNGTGGFTRDGKEYVITTIPGAFPPAPWCNVMANPNFGTVLTETGGAYSWFENAHEFRLSPWGNDPVTDPSGEALYLRDEETGHAWSPTPLPLQDAAHPAVTRHGFGYSVFERNEDGIASELWIYVDVQDPIKFSVLKVKNESGRPRRLSATAYVEWVLGDLRHKTAPFIVTAADGETGALTARNVYSAEFSTRTAFLDTDEATRTLTGDRAEFIGRNGSLRDPAALSRVRLSGKLGAVMEPCGAMMAPFVLEDGQEREIIFRLGVAAQPGDLASLIRRHRGSAAARRALEAVWAFWNHTLGAIQVQTPDLAVDMMVNGWLLYQTIACRLWARSGFYQSGGAFGFRDQLQDCMAVIHTLPGLLRDHLLLAASRQFKDGDVQHWWHPPAGQGVRTHCSDDYLWLPFALCRYVLTTGDSALLDEPVPFLDGRTLAPDQESYYDMPWRSQEKGNLYDHCVLAVKRGLVFGPHKLPLIGTGDWNDGMNLVGAEGRGESVWLAFFLYAVLNQFGPLARSRGDEAFADQCRDEAARLKRNIEQEAWDGGWYRRAWFDDGTPLGSQKSPECRIDSLSQSWAVLSGAGDADRARMAMKAVDDRLVRRDSALIQLLDPPFDSSSLNPGYIKGYVPGVRENGGQYTHGAIWTAMAFAELDDPEKAWELLDMIMPVSHADSPEKTAVYKTEPYVAAADVYARPPHVGRGGWTWYTGSAGWMYRLMVESLLGLNLENNRLRLKPRLPAAWESCLYHYRYRETMYHIRIQREAEGPTDLTLDGVRLPDFILPLVDDRSEHEAVLRLPKAAP